MHQVRGPSRPVAIFSEIGYDLSEPMTNYCNIVTNINIARTHSLRAQLEFVLAKLLKEKLGDCFDAKENINSDFALYHFNKTTRFKKSRTGLNFYAKKQMICLEIII